MIHDHGHIRPSGPRTIIRHPLAVSARRVSLTSGETTGGFYLSEALTMCRKASCSFKSIAGVVTAVLTSVYGIMKVCFDFYALVRGH